MSTLVLSCLIESYSFLQVARTAIKAWMGLKFSKIEHGSMEMAALECLKKSLNHVSLDEFEFLQDPITNY